MRARALLFAACLAVASLAHAQQPGDDADPRAGAQGEAPADTSAPPAAAGAPGDDSAAAASASAPPDQSASAPSAEPTATPTPDPAFLSLPAYDVEPASPGASKVGDELQLKIVGAGQLSSPSGFRLGLPSGMEPGTVLDQGLEIPALTDSDGEAVTAGASPPALSLAGPDLKFAVIAAKPGQLAIPSLAIQDGTGKAVARTNPFTLQVASAIAPGDQKPKDPAPPRPPVKLSFPWIVIAAFALLAALALAGIVYGIVRYSRRARPPEPEPAPPPPKSEDEIALAAFAELERQQLMRKGMYKAHYFQLSETLKAYLGARYRVDAVESTTREMLAMLEHSTLPPESLRELGGMFTQLDFVKFTDHVPDREEGDLLLTQAKALVLKTRKPPQAAPSILAGSPAGAAAAAAATPEEAPRAV